MKELESTNVATLGETPTSRRIISYPLLERYCIAPVSRWKERLPRIIVEGLTDIFAYPIYVKGIENLDATQELIREGKKIEIWSNHLSYVDPLVIMAGLKKAGHRGIAENTVPIEGLKLRMNPVRKFFASGFETIRVVPPSIEPKNEEENKMNIKSLKETMATLKRGINILIFPEATRSKTQQLEKGTSGVAHYLNPYHNDEYVPPEDIFVLPIGVWGTEKILPVGAVLPDGNAANVSFGEPRPVSEALERSANISNRETRRQILVDYFMLLIAYLLPEEYRGVYANET